MSLKLNIRYQSIISYFDAPLSKKAALWIDAALRGADVVDSWDNPDYIEISDFDRFQKLRTFLKPPEEIKKEVLYFFDCCEAAYKRHGKIYIDLEDFC